MARARGYEPRFSSEAQDAQLDAMIARVREVGADGVCVFDLDGCMFDTRPRQIAIFREYASRSGALDLYAVEPAHFRNWDLRDTMRNAGLNEERVEALYGELRDYWWKNFFTSAYVQLDHAMPGAVALVRACHSFGSAVVYLTGRDETMRAGTESALRRFGFPLHPPRAQLIVKPDFKTEDTEFKDFALERVRKLGAPVLLMDNEPANANLFHTRFPDALTVFVETDHSPRPDEPHPDIPWLRSFLRTQ